MKGLKFLTHSLIVAFSSIALLASCSEKVIPAADLPNEVSNYIETHFAGKEIMQAKRDKGDRDERYEVIIEGYYTLIFNKKKKIRSIKGVDALPESVIPERIRTFVAEKHPTTYIIEWELDDKDEQEIKLNNLIELKFNSAGHYLSMDIN
ncbi:MAG: PepSY-like domain-containing protein [Bacteroidales bacterium]